MKLFFEGITRNTENPNIIVDLKKAGYVEVAEREQKLPTIEEIYALCEKAGVKPDALHLEGENPTLAEVKAAIAAAKKAG